MDEEKLIELVHQNPILYDTYHPKYMDLNFKNKVWDRIGELMGLQTTACKTRWFHIRDNYRRSLRKITSTGRIKRKYKYADQVCFIKDFLSERKIKNYEELKLSNEEIPDSITHNVVNIKDEYVNPDDMQDVCENTPSQSPVDDVVQSEMNEMEYSQASDSDRDELAKTPELQKVTLKRRRKQPVAASMALMKYLIQRNQDLATASTDPVDTFLAGIATTLRNLTPYHLNLAKTEIFGIVQKYELRMITKSQQGPQTFTNDTRISAQRQDDPSSSK